MPQEVVCHFQLNAAPVIREDTAVPLDTVPVAEGPALAGLNPEAPFNVAPENGLPIEVLFLHF